MSFSCNIDLFSFTLLYSLLLPLLLVLILKAPPSSQEWGPAGTTVQVTQNVIAAPCGGGKFTVNEWGRRDHPSDAESGRQKKVSMDLSTGRTDITIQIASTRHNLLLFGARVKPSVTPGDMLTTCRTCLYFYNVTVFSLFKGFTDSHVWDLTIIELLMGS